MNIFDPRKHIFDNAMGSQKPMTIFVLSKKQNQIYKAHNGTDMMLSGLLEVHLQDL